MRGFMRGLMGGVEENYMIGVREGTHPTIHPYQVLADWNTPYLA